MTALVVVLVAVAWSPGAARADGDPASDVLVSQPLFLPTDAGLTVAQQARLEALLVDASRRGYPLRVAIISSPTDLGSITELWRQPAGYARFLDQELSLVYRGTLLVVMPAGFGVYGPAAGIPAQRGALAGLRPGSPGPGLGAAATSAVRRLAAAAGHPLGVGVVSARSVVTSQTDYAALLALAGGALLIMLAWGLSLRARPPGSRPQAQP